jgi:SAM-dependent methyltransferase
MNNTFLKYAKYYDLLYADKKYEEEVHYISQLIRDCNIVSNSLLELGSGTGKHARSLIREGFQVTGIELSQAMVDRANEKAVEGFKCYQGNICDVDLDQKFGAIISLFHVVSYITTNEALTKLFQNVTRHLELGGLFAFDFWYGAAVLSQGVETRIKRIKDGSNEVIRIAESKIRDQDNCVDVNYTISMIETKTSKVEVFSEIHTMRYFSLPELDYYAEIYGLKRILQEEFLTKNPPGMNTWGVCAVYRKVA